MSPLKPRPVASERDILSLITTHGRPAKSTSRAARAAIFLRSAFGWLLVLASVLGAAIPAQAAITVTRTSDAFFYISNQAASNDIRNMYVAYRITNTGPSAQSDVWVKLDTFTGGVVTLASGEDGLYHIGPLAAGQSQMAYLYLTASATTNTAQTHTVRVYDRRPDLIGAVQLASSLQTLAAVRSSIASSANKVDILVTGPDPAALGGVVTITVQGRTGTIGAGDILVYTPASYTSWPADQLELFSTSVSFNGITGSNCNNTNLGTFTDQLSISFSLSACYTAVYKLRVRGFTTSPTLASPILHAVSGSNFKHTDPADLALLTPIAVTTSNIRLVKSVSPTTLPSGGNATYTVHVTNPASNAGCPVGSPNCNDVQLDDVVDVLPTSPGVGTYVAGTSKLDGVTINVHFDLNADTISTTSAGVLDSVAAVMQAVPQIHATLIGHTDPRGSVAYNLALGRRRAHAVYFFLIAAGVDSSRLSFGSEGKAAPVAIGNGVREHALNRRVEIQYSGPSGVQLEVHHQERDLQLERSRKPAAQGSAAQRKRTAIRKRATALAP